LNQIYIQSSSPLTSPESRENRSTSCPYTLMIECGDFTLTCWSWNSNDTGSHLCNHSHSYRCGGRP